jgi:hypothetical protein
VLRGKWDLEGSDDWGLEEAGDFFFGLWSGFGAAFIAAVMGWGADPRDVG